jgi:hypothetical protein
LKIAMTSLTTSRLLAVLAVGGGLAVCAAAHAQYVGAPNSNPLTGGTRGPKAAPEAPAPAPAPAIPGSRPADAPAPAEHLPLDLAPTEALFDAINRGDVAASRDAIRRGADLNGRNLLGLTPLELSVDLGRNNISFLLLSLRGSGGERAQSAAAETEPAPPHAPPQRGRSRQARRQLEEAPAAAPAPFPVSGGTPVPAAGFLGFDIGRTGER